MMRLRTIGTDPRAESRPKLPLASLRWMIIQSSHELKPPVEVLRCHRDYVVSGGERLRKVRDDRTSFTNSTIIKLKYHGQQHIHVLRDY